MSPAALLISLEYGAKNNSGDCNKEGCGQAGRRNSQSHAHAATIEISLLGRINKRRWDSGGDTQLRWGSSGSWCSLGSDGLTRTNLLDILTWWAVPHRDPAVGAGPSAWKLLTTIDWQYATVNSAHQVRFSLTVWSLCNVRLLVAWQCWN